MTILQAYPRARRWLRNTIERHRSDAAPVHSRVYPRLEACCPLELLASALVVVVDQMPRPPLEKWNLHALDDFGFFNAEGLTLDNVIFLRRGFEGDESLLFHELVHVIQWKNLGRARFLTLYGLSLHRQGYDQNPLELMAFELQARFDAGTLDFDLAPIINRRVEECAARFRRESLSNRLVDVVARMLP